MHDIIHQIATKRTGAPIFSPLPHGELMGVPDNRCVVLMFKDGTAIYYYVGKTVGRLMFENKEGIGVLVEKGDREKMDSKFESFFNRESIYTK